METVWEATRARYIVGLPNRTRYFRLRREAESWLQAFRDELAPMRSDWEQPSHRFDGTLLVELPVAALTRRMAWVIAAVETAMQAWCKAKVQGQLHPAVEQEVDVSIQRLADSWEAATPLLKEMATQRIWGGIPKTEPSIYILQVGSQWIATPDIDHLIQWRLLQPMGEFGALEVLVDMRVTTLNVEEIQWLDPGRAKQQIEQQVLKQQVC